MKLMLEIVEATRRSVVVEVTASGDERVVCRIDKRGPSRWVRRWSPATVAWSVWGAQPPGTTMAFGAALLAAGNLAAALDAFLVDASSDDAVAERVWTAAVSFQGRQP